MKVLMRTTAAGPKGTLMAGKEYDLSGETARQFVAGGYAEIIDGKKQPVAEVTSLEPAPETTTMPKPKRRGRGKQSADKA